MGCVGLLIVGWIVNVVTFSLKNRHELGIEKRIPLETLILRKIFWCFADFLVCSERKTHDLYAGRA